MLAEANGKTYCIPLACEIQDGAREMMSWRYGASGERQGSHVRESIVLSYYMGERLGDTILLADRLYLTVPALEELDWLNSHGGRHMDIVTMAKSNAVAYEELPAQAHGARGRPRVKGDAVKLGDLFKTRAGEFEAANVFIYDKWQEVKHLCVDLRWGKGLYKKMRFVLTNTGGAHAILACTDISIGPLAIIELYGRRFSIECTFRSLKQDVAAFSNRFWTSSTPELDIYAKSGEPDRATKITNERSREKSLDAFDANERYAFCGVMALGLLQLLSLKFSDDVIGNLRYQRTPSKKLPSEACIADYLRKNVFRLLARTADLSISQKIHGLMRDPDADYETIEAS